MAKTEQEKYVSRVSKGARLFHEYMDDFWNRFQKDPSEEALAHLKETVGKVTKLLEFGIDLDQLDKAPESIKEQKRNKEYIENWRSRNEKNPHVTDTPSEDSGSTGGPTTSPGTVEGTDTGPKKVGGDEPA